MNETKDLCDFHRCTSPVPSPSLENSTKLDVGKPDEGHSVTEV